MPCQWFKNTHAFTLFRFACQMFSQRVLKIFSPFTTCSHILKRSDIFLPLFLNLVFVMPYTFEALCQLIYEQRCRCQWIPEAGIRIWRLSTCICSYISYPCHKENIWKLLALHMDTFYIGTHFNILTADPELGYELALHIRCYGFSSMGPWIIPRPPWNPIFICSHYFVYYNHIMKVIQNTYRYI